MKNLQINRKQLKKELNYITLGILSSDSSNKDSSHQINLLMNLIRRTLNLYPRVLKIKIANNIKDKELITKDKGPIDRLTYLDKLIWIV